MMSDALGKGQLLPVSAVSTARRDGAVRRVAWRRCGVLRCLLDGATGIIYGATSRHQAAPHRCVPL